MKFIKFRKITNYFEKDINVLKNWKIVLLWFAAILIIVLLIDNYLFWKYQREAFQPVDLGDTGFVTINRTSLQNVIDWLNIKEGKFNEDLNAPKIKDPSL